jgi:hypothetical protein
MLGVAHKMCKFFACLEATYFIYPPSQECKFFFICAQHLAGVCCHVIGCLGSKTSLSWCTQKAICMAAANARECSSWPQNVNLGNEWRD